MHVCMGGGGATGREEGVKEAAGWVEAGGRRVGGDLYRALEGPLSGVDLTDVTVEVVRPRGIGGEERLVLHNRYNVFRDTCVLISISRHQAQWGGGAHLEKALAQCGQM